MTTLVIAEHDPAAGKPDMKAVTTLIGILPPDVVNGLVNAIGAAKGDEDTRTPEELLDLIEAKGREVAEALAVLRTG